MFNNVQKKSRSSKKEISEQLLDLFKIGVFGVQPKNILDSYLKVIKKQIIVKKSTSKKKVYSNVNKIFPICIGKASVDMAKKVKEIFKNSDLKIEKGVVIVNKENFKKIPGFKCFSSNHPVPDKNGFEATNYLRNYLSNLNANDLVLVFISGGGSALAPLPVDQINLKDKVLVNKILLECGANIKEINAVRKHLSKIKGGNLCKICFPAYIQSFILSDVIGDDLSSIASGMTTYDETTFSDVQNILKKYRVWKKIPTKVQNFIKLGEKNKELETPKKNDVFFKKTNNILIGSNNLCLEKIQKYCESSKISSKIWIRNIEGDVRKVTKDLARKIKNIKIKRPIILISGGETTVKVKGSGKGGRNQEFGLYFCKEMKIQNPNQKFYILSAGTDGRDGPTNSAGAILSHSSLTDISKNKINLSKELKNNNSYEVLKKIKSLVIIDGTNTNVADVQLIYLS